MATHNFDWLAAASEQAAQQFMMQAPQPYLGAPVLYATPDYATSSMTYVPPKQELPPMDFDVAALALQQQVRMDCHVCHLLDGLMKHRVSRTRRRRRRPGAIVRDRPTRIHQSSQMYWSLWQDFATIQTRYQLLLILLSSVSSCFLTWGSVRARTSSVLFP